MSDQDTNVTSEWQKRKMGALWRREGKSQNYLTGEITVGEFGVEKTYRVVIYTNKYKSTNENAPDFIIYQSKDKDEGDTDAPSSIEAPADISSDIADEVPDLLQ